LALAVLMLPPSAAAAVVPRPVQHVGQLQGSSAFVAIVEKGERFQAYLSDATPEDATLSVWIRGRPAADGSFAGASHGVQLAGRIAGGRATGAATLPDGRVLRFDIPERRGGLVERHFVHEGVRYRSGWIVLEDNRVRGRTMVAGTALTGGLPAGPGIRPNASCEQLEDDIETLRVERGKLSHQSGRWELRLNRGRGSGAAYRRLNWARGALEEQILLLERPQAACDSPSAASLASAGPVSARKSTRTSLKA
jgi:hypothetical protein